MNSVIKVIPALAVFVAVVSIPFWANAGGAEKMEEPEMPNGPTECVESREWMRTNHMKLLDDWRDRVVRDHEMEYTNQKGQKFDMSLTKTCMQCHTSQEKFCERCHKSVGVKNYCWDCHFTPDMVKGGIK